MAALIRRMAELGATAEAIAVAVEAIEAERTKEQERKAKRAAQKAAERARKDAMSRDCSATVGDNSATVGDNSATVGDTSSPEDTQNSSSTSENNQTPITPIAPSSAKKARRPSRPIEYHGDFEMLWAEFPRNPNSSKTEAYKAWLKLDVDDREKCFDGALEYVQWLKAKGKQEFILHLVTFINQRRFDTLLEAKEAAE